MVESKILSIVKKHLDKLSKAKKSVNAETITDIRRDVYKSTSKYKSASSEVIKKWIKEARADMAKIKKKTLVKKTKKVEKKAPKKKKIEVKKEKPKKETKTVKEFKSTEQEVEIPKISQSVKRSLDEIKSEISIPNVTRTSPATEISVSRSPLVLDKVYLQSMSFEMASMRQALDRIGRQLDKLERELSAHRNGED